MTFVYLVRCNFTTPAKEQAWNAWYSGPKISQMLAQPHFMSCQRFRRISGTGRDYVALWVVESPEALTTPQYISQWGFAEWEHDVTAWSRDLFDAGKASPSDFSVEWNAALEVLSFDGMSADDMSAVNAAIVQAGKDMMWLPVAGLDRHTPLIGLRVSTDPAAESPAGAHVQRGIYRPICEFRTARHSP